ncbi:hypothetical protein HY408_00890, partial [Candidatus Gottesmanbacteria bacterium]|nr:hypothetical protein [Candidatus Gottesmanbacteria bacterium]
AVARGGTSWFVQEKVPFGKTATSLALYYGAVKDFVGALFAGSSVERIGKLAAAGLEWKAARSDNTAFRAAAVAGSGAIKDVVEKVFVGTGGGK